ncbi:Cag pathogenicity island protein Cag12 [Salmonella enterica]|nr:Cag pathogenicity island protein Cag12 [Salmonella enterica]
MKRVFIIFFLALLAGCSSPPPPPPVDWKSAPEPENTTLPQWQPNNAFIKAPEISGRWSKVIYNFRGDSETWTPDVFYAVLHSQYIVVATSPKADFFAAKAWLRQHGAKGVIHYQAKNDCMTCDSVDIYLMR